MKKTQLQPKRNKLHNFLIVLVYFFLCGTSSSHAVEKYLNEDDLVVGTSDSRLVATIIETDTGVTLQVIAIGEMNFNAAEYAFFIKHGEFVLSDKTFTKELSYGAFNSNPDMFTDNVDLGIDLLKYGSQNLDFNISAKTSYRKSGEGLLAIYSSVDKMDALVISIFNAEIDNHFTQPEGETNTIFTCYFKKLTPGRALNPDDLGIGTKITYTGGRFCPKWMYAGYNVTYTTNYISSQSVVPEQFSYRTPSSVTMDNIDQITHHSATLYGNFKRGNMSPANDLLEGYRYAFDEYELQYNGRLNWDRVTQRGFIYAPETVSISIKEYSDTLIINGEKYLFPSPSEVTTGQFTRGSYTFHIITENNSDASASVTYNASLSNLEPNITYSVWPYIKYAYETSREYSKIGDPISFKTENDCSLPITSDKSDQVNIDNDYTTGLLSPPSAVKNTISIYPNPLVSSQIVYVDANVDEKTLEKASIEIYSPAGSYIEKMKAQRLTPVRLPEEKGIYILKFRSGKMEENFKVIAK